MLSGSFLIQVSLDVYKRQGIGLSQVIAKVAEVPVAISSASIVVSVVFSMVVGLVFGLIPSIKAAKLNPIHALRYE